jgi:dipeptidyl aminopeptidase/acylaminoacyl peptidase
MQSAVRKMFDDSVIDDTILERMTYFSDGLKVNGYIARPKAEGRYPVLIWNRGGSGDRGALDDLRAYLILSSTAVWGYVVLATQYRGNMGGEGKEDWGGKDLDDALRLIDVAAEIEQADTSRMAIEGASRGGMTTYRALATDHPFKCAIVHAGISNLEALADEKEDFDKFLSKLFGDRGPEGKRDTLRELSAVHFAERFKKNVPLLLMHGTNDNTIPLSQTVSLAKRLERLGVEHRFEPIEGGGHVALKDGSYREIDRHRQTWLARYLGTPAD